MWGPQGPHWTVLQPPDLLTKVLSHLNDKAKWDMTLPLSAARGKSANPLTDICKRAVYTHNYSIQQPQGNNRTFLHVTLYHRKDPALPMRCETCLGLLELSNTGLFPNGEMPSDLWDRSENPLEDGFMYWVQMLTGRSCPNLLNLFENSSCKPKCRVHSAKIPVQTRNGIFLY